MPPLPIIRKTFSVSGKHTYKMPGFRGDGIDSDQNRRTSKCDIVSQSQQAMVRKAAVDNLLDLVLADCTVSNRKRTSFDDN